MQIGALVLNLDQVVSFKLRVDGDEPVLVIGLPFGKLFVRGAKAEALHGELTAYLKPKLLNTDADMLTAQEMADRTESTIRAIDAEN